MEEKVFKSKLDVRYLYEESIDSDHLIVIFSAFSPKGKPPLYNYIKTLKDVDCNKLFILDDFGSRGSYYLSFNDGLDNHIEQSVMALIEDICLKNNITKKNIIAMGSSKGGFASLYYSIKYNFGYTIAGSPQIFIGKYLNDAKQYDVLGHFLGQTTEETLNYALLNLSSTEDLPELYVHVGREEQHYYEHVKVFVEKFKVKELDLADYNSHNDVALYFPNYITNTLAKILGKSYIEDIFYYKDERNNKYIFNGLANGNDLKYAWYILDGNNDSVIEKFNYSSDNKFEYLFKNQGIYKAKLFIKDSFGNVLSKNTPRIIFN